MHCTGATAFVDVACILLQPLSTMVRRNCVCDMGNISFLAFQYNQLGYKLI